MKIVVFVLVVVFFFVIYNKDGIYQKKEISHVTLLSQDVDKYSKNLVEDSSKLNQSDYERKYYNIWNVDSNYTNKDNIKWAFNTYKVGKSYGENLRLLKQDFFDKMLDNSNYEEYLTLNKKAITLQEVNLRAFPTDKPLFLNPKKAGEGFPFDYLQNSSIHANKPLLATHYSKDKEWVHVFSSFAFGWIKVKDLVFLEKEQSDRLEKAQHVFMIKDNIPIYSTKGEYLFKSKLGMMLRVIDENETDYKVLSVSFKRLSTPLFVEANISKKVAHKNILAFNRKNIDRVMRELLKSKYGWGGMYGERDCSSTMRDFFAPFGLWLPRNSYKQSLVGNVIPLDGLSDDEKIDKIKREAIAFKTLFYKKGHILLYTGLVNNKITVFQNVWGVKTKKDDIEGRYIIGRAVFSDLNLGSELRYYDKNSNTLKNLKSMNILF